MIVKVCGIKTLADALAALEAGAGMLGFNFYPPSPRCITPEACAEIISSLRKLGKQALYVGVFVNDGPGRVREMVDYCALDLAQLSGNEPPATLAALDGGAFKAVRPVSLSEAGDLLRTYARSSPPALLVDSHVKGAYGGTGETGNWTIAQSMAERAPVLLAGGLTPQNVGAAIRLVRPWGVDVASGVESCPGVKDPARMRAFMEAVRGGETLCERNNNDPDYHHTI
jgi:phosphoribosylanthranilate isomerase